METTFWTSTTCKYEFLEQEYKTQEEAQAAVEASNGKLKLEIIILD